MTELVFETGSKVYHFILRRRLPVNRKLVVNMQKRWVVECECGTQLTIPEYYMRRPNPKKHCGCLDRTLFTEYPQEAGIWRMMHVRTEDPSHVSYKHYGGRGIRVCPEWHKSRGLDGFKAFLDFVGPRPSPQHSIDRVNNDLGYQPYQPNGERQVRWATSVEQRANQRPKT